MLRVIQKFIPILAFVTVGCARQAEQPSPSQVKADATAGAGLSEEASLSYSVQHHLKEYEVRIVRQEDNKDHFYPFTVRIVDKGQEIYNFRARRNGVHTTRGYGLRRGFLSNLHRMHDHRLRPEGTQGTLEDRTQGQPSPRSIPNTGTR